MKISYFNLGDTIPNWGLYRLHARDVLALETKIRPEEVLVIDISSAGNKAELIAELKLQFPLPEYCGQNWDALEESLGDLVIGKIIVISGVSNMEQLSKASYKTFTEILYQSLAKRHLVLLLDNRLVLS